MLLVQSMQSLFKKCGMLRDDADKVCIAYLELSKTELLCVVLH